MYKKEKKKKRQTNSEHFERDALRVVPDTSSHSSGQNRNCGCLLGAAGLCQGCCGLGSCMMMDMVEVSISGVCVCVGGGLQLRGGSLQPKAGRCAFGRHGGLFFPSWCADFHCSESENGRKVLLTYHQCDSKSSCLFTLLWWMRRPNWGEQLWLKMSATEPGSWKWTMKQRHGGDGRDGGGGSLWRVLLSRAWRHWQQIYHL